MQLVKNEEKYWEFIRVLRNTNNGFVEQVNITKDEQRTYMYRYTNDYWVCLIDKKPVGFIGIVNNDLRLAVDKNHRRKGVATFMIKELPRMLNNVTIKILYDNDPSRKLFEKVLGKPKYVMYEY